MRSVRMVETPLVFARLATLFLLACAEPPDSAQSPSTRMIRPNLASPAASSPKNDLMPLMTSSSNLGIPTPISPPQTPQKDILIYGPSLLGAPNNELTLAMAAGHNVTVADPGTWSLMTTADFAQFRAIVFGDPSCQDTPEPTLTVAEANRATWSAAVRGNMVVIGSDPIVHQLQGQANQLTTNAINFAASSAATGLYMSLSCYYFDAPVNTPVTVLSDFGDFRVQGQVTPPLSDQAVPGCPNDVTIVAPDHPVVQGIMKPGLDNWTCSIHEAFNAFPAASLGVVVRDTPSALPYVIAGSSPKARLCVNEEEDRGNGEVEDENGGDGGDFDFDECDENHEFHHRDPDRNVDFHSTKKDDVPKFDLSILKATSTGSGLNNGLPVTYTLVVTDLGIGPGTDLYSLTLQDGSGAIVYSRTGLLRLGDVVVHR